MNRIDVFEQLQGKGVAKAVADFSGGNDEGYVEAVRLLDAENRDIETLRAHSNELGEAIAAPVYERYGSFAGDFSVSGCIVWDVATKKVSLDYSETEWVDHSEEV